MPIDVSIQFNGHNSYRVTETVFCDPFGVEGWAYLTHSFHAFAGSALGAATRARTRFFKADGSIAGTTDHSFTVAAIFTEVDITVAVPGTAVLCQMSFLTSGTWWVAEPKSEEGQTATPYNTNYQGQLSMITPDGAYLGMLTTAQIVVAGTLADPTESLDTRLVTINNNAINLSATSAAHGSRLTNIEAGAITLASVDTAHGNRLTSIEAGVIVISGSASYAAGYDPTTKETPTGAQSKANAAESNATAVANTKETPAGAQAKVNALGATLGDMAFEDLVTLAKLGTTIVNGGYLQTILINADYILAGTLAAARIAAGSITVDKLAAGTITGDKIAAGTITVDKIDVSNLVAQRISNIADSTTYAEIGAVGTYKGISLTRPAAAGQSAGPFLRIVTGTNAVYFYDINNQRRITIAENGDMVLTDGSNATRMAITNGGDFIVYSADGTKGIGSDNTGAFKWASGSKTYL